MSQQELWGIGSQANAQGTFGWCLGQPSAQNRANVDWAAKDYVQSSFDASTEVEEWKCVFLFKKL